MVAKCRSPFARRLFASIVRKTRLRLRSDNVHWDNKAKTSIDEIISGLYEETCDSRNRRRLEIRREAYEVLQLIDLHAEKNFQPTVGSSAVTNLVYRLTHDTLLTNQVRDILLDMGLNLPNDHVRAFVELLVECMAPSMWKFLMERIGTNEKLKGGLSFRTTLKIIGKNRSVIGEREF